MTKIGYRIEKTEYRNFTTPPSQRSKVKNYGKRKVWNILPIGFCLLAFGLLTAGVSVESKVDKNRVLIGDRINYIVKITYPKNWEIIKPPLASNLGSFEIKDFSIGKPKKEEGGLESITFDFVIATFDTGSFTIPPTGIAYTDTVGKKGVVTTPPINIYVASLLGDKASWKLRDIKTPLILPFPYRKLLLWVIPPLLILGVLLTIYLRRRKRSLAGFIDISHPARPPYEVALERLNNLTVPEILEFEEANLFFVELTEIVRQYVEDSFDVIALELTTYEIIEELKDRLSPELLSLLDSILSLADLVKFAKFIPPAEEFNEALEGSKRFVEETMPKPEIKPESEPEAVAVTDE